VTFIEEVAVPVVEVAKRAGLTPDEVRAEAAALNMFIGEDWRHEPALSARDAFVLLDGSARRNRDHELAWRQHTIALEEWQAERERVRREAFDEAWQANVSAGWGNSPAVSKAHESAREAVAAYEVERPEPAFSEPETRMAALIRRVKAGVR
jgi:hypothetical protein